MTQIIVALTYQIVTRVTLIEPKRAFFHGFRLLGNQNETDLVFENGTLKQPTLAQSLQIPNGVCLGKNECFNSYGVHLWSNYFRRMSICCYSSNRPFNQVRASASLCLQQFLAAALMRYVLLNAKL